MPTLLQFGNRQNIWATIRNLAEAQVGPFTFAGTPVDGTSGTFAGFAKPGSLLIDTTNGAFFINVGTQASPTWLKTSGSSSIQSAEVSITNAQMLALRATPVTLVAAPGAGKVLEFLGGVLLFDRTAVYTETTDNMAVKYSNGAGTAISVAIESTGFVDAAADAVYFVQPIAGTILGVKTLFENLPLVLHNTGDGEFGGGNAANVVRAKMNYRVWATGF